MAESKTINIYDEEFTVSTPYAEGHVITAAEAKALNQVRAENIANNFRAKIKAAKEDGTLDKVRADLATYRPHHRPGTVEGYWSSPPCQQPPRPRLLCSRCRRP